MSRSTRVSSRAVHREGARGRLSLIEALRTATRRLHARAECSGLIRKVLAGNATMTEYAMLLRNLLPAYEALEGHLAALPDDHPIAPIRDPRLYRTAAIRADLAAICGRGWEALPLTAAGREYGERIRALEGAGISRIAGHCYTRYLGDLSGGQILRRRLAARPGVPAAAMRFYEFELPVNRRRYKMRYIKALDALTDDSREIDAIVDEAVAAFRLNIGVSEELARLGVQSDDRGSARFGTR